MWQSTELLVVPHRAVADSYRPVGLSNHIVDVKCQEVFPMAQKPIKQSSDKVSTLASKVLSGSKKPTSIEVKSLAASVLSQDEKKGRRG